LESFEPPGKPLPSYPTTGIVGRWARAARGPAIAIAPNTKMNPRRFISLSL
jgi:hypothetical protein